MVSHSEQLIHTYGSDWVLVGYAVAGLCCVMMGDLKKALRYYHKVKGNMMTVTHIQTKIVTATFQFMSGLIMQAYSMAHIDFASYMNAIVRDGGENHMFVEFSYLLVEEGKCLALNESHKQPSRRTSSSNPSRRTSNPSRRISSSNPSRRHSLPSRRPSNMSEGSDGSTSVLSEDSMENKIAFDYTQILVDSDRLDAVAVSKNRIAILLALRYGKGEEVYKAELCLLEARRLHVSLTTLLATLARKNKRPSVSNKLASIMKPLTGMLARAPFWNRADRSGSNGHDLDSSVEIEAKIEKIRKEAKIYCLAGIKFLDFSLATYPVYDSMVNRLMCFVVKTELLVVSADFTQNEDLIMSKLIDSAHVCLQSALDLNLPYEFELPLLLCGLRYVQLGLNVKKGKELLTAFLLIIVNRDKAPDEVIVDVNTVFNDTTVDYEWIKDIPVISTVMMLIRDV
jgi:hypothetical protein